MKESLEKSCGFVFLFGTGEQRRRVARKKKHENLWFAIGSYRQLNASNSCYFCAEFARFQVCLAKNCIDDPRSSGSSRSERATKLMVEPWAKLAGVRVRTRTHDTRSHLCSDCRSRKLLQINSIENWRAVTDSNRSASLAVSAVDVLQGGRNPSSRAAKRCGD